MGLPTNHHDKTAPDEHIHWDIGTAFFILFHLLGACAFWVGFSWPAIMACFIFYYLRMFFITAAYHRYFAHRSYKTSRWFQFILAFGGGTSVQKGALWWGGHHRTHHKYSDTTKDLHSAKRRGFYWSHLGWIMAKRSAPTPWSNLKDWEKYPELVWLNRNHWVPPAVFGLFVLVLGMALEVWAPEWGVTCWQMLLWGFCLSTTLLYHGTFFINSLSHVYGTQRYETGDESRNSLLLSLITLGEGWHNNHHKYPFSERQGFFWWELDATHLGLKVLSWFRLVWDLQRPPARAFNPATFTRSPGPLWSWPKGGG